MSTDPSTFDAALLSVHFEILVKGAIFLANNTLATLRVVLEISIFGS